MRESVDVMLAKIDAKLDTMGKKLDGHLSEHFKMRLAAYGFTATLIISLVIVVL